MRTSTRVHECLPASLSEDSLSMHASYVIDISATGREDKDVFVTAYRAGSLLASGAAMIS